MRRWPLRRRPMSHLRQWRRWDAARCIDSALASPISSEARKLAMVSAPHGARTRARYAVQSSKR